jgi:hypothetical protein
MATTDCAGNAITRRIAGARVELLAGIPVMALLVPWHDVIQMTQQSLTSKMPTSTPGCSPSGNLTSRV